MNKIDKEQFDKEHHSRNMGLLTEEDQQKIGDVTLLIAGCGVGSQVALSAARMGFEKFVLVDGDTVELSNNNRQGYSWRDVGRYKVDALAHKIKAINPHATIRKHRLFIDAQNADKLVRKADIVLDIIDPDSIIAVIALHRAAIKHKKFVIQPNDLGWGASVHIFSPNSMSFEKMIGLNPKEHINNIDPVVAKAKFFELGMQVMPDYAKMLLSDLAAGKIAHYPQPISAAYILSAMTIMAAKRLALSLPVKLAPDYISFDPFDELDPNYSK